MVTSNYGSTMFNQVRRNRLFVGIFVLFCVLLTIAWLVLGTIKKEVRYAVTETLHTQRDTVSRGLSNWLDARREMLDTISVRPLVIAQLRASMEGDEEAKAWLEGTMMHFISSLHFVGYMIVSPEREVELSNMCQTGIGVPPKLSHFLDLSRDKKASVLSPPMYMSLKTTAETKHEGIDATYEKHICLHVCAPIQKRSGGIYGYLVLLMRAEDGFNEILAEARFGESGESYAVDKNGMLLTPSRFTEQLHACGLLDGEESSAALQVAVRNPGKNIIEDHGQLPSIASLPLTVSAAGIAEGTEGSQLDGYNDYRGIPVVGAWQWLPEYNLGFICEIDEAEAYRPLGVLRMLFSSLFVIILAAIAVGIVIWWRNATFKRRAKQAEARLQRLGQYTLQEKIGEGGMGAVYVGFHGMLKRKTAIKLITGNVNEESLMLFEREVRLCCQLTHPNTIQVYDYGRTAEGTFYYAMEMLDGADLETVVREKGCMPAERVIHILRQCCMSLSEAHDMNLIHRDIKPANIYLTRCGQEFDFVKVLDFGLAKSLDNDAPKLSAADTIAGTPEYMCPEIIQQSQDVDGRSDIYSLGIVGYFLLCGQTPFQGTQIMGILHDHVNREPKSLQEINATVPDDLQKVILSCLAKDPVDRPLNAQALRAALNTCADAYSWDETQAQLWWQSSWSTKEVPAVKPDQNATPTIILAPAAD